jgi:hypothetical protein
MHSWINSFNHLKKRSYVYKYEVHRALDEATLEVVVAQPPPLSCAPINRHPQEAGWSQLSLTEIAFASLSPTFSIGAEF